MRADRLLAIVLMLQNKKRVTAAELAQKLEVSERTIYRDMDALTTAGIPVVAERGNQGGWRLLEGYRANLDALYMNELQTLFVNQPLFADLGIGQMAQNALLKLLASVPTDEQAQVENVNQRLFVDPVGWQRTQEPVTCLPTLQAAVWGSMQLKLQYRRADNTVVERLVLPLGLIAKGGIWYLAAEVDGEVRTYRVSRILTASLTDQHFARPQEFDLRAYWYRSAIEHLENIARYPVTLRVSPQSLMRIRNSEAYFRIDVLFASELEGWSQIQIFFGSLDEAREFVLSFGVSIEVIEPNILRDEVVRAAVEIINLYQSHR